MSEMLLPIPVIIERKFVSQQVAVYLVLVLPELSPQVLEILCPDLTNKSARCFLDSMSDCYLLPFSFRAKLLACYFSDIMSVCFFARQTAGLLIFKLLYYKNLKESFSIPFVFTIGWCEGFLSNDFSSSKA